MSLGKAVANQKDLPAFIHSLANFETALVRVDLPLGVSLKGQPTAGRVAPLVSEQSPVEAQFLGPAPSADLAMQGQGFLFLLKGNSLPPGAAVVGWLKVPGEAESGVIVPREAILRHEGEVFVYLQTGDETFQRREIELERPLANGWFVGEGLKKNQKVVVVGAQQLLSEELKSAGGE